MTNTVLPPHNEMLLTEILALSQQMKSQAEDDQWEAFAESDVCRKKLMQQLDINNSSAHNIQPKKVVDLLQHITTLNDQLVHYANNKTQSLQEDVLATKRRAKANQIYQNK